MTTTTKKPAKRRAVTLRATKEFLEKLKVCADYNMNSKEAAQMFGVDDAVLRKFIQRNAKAREIWGFRTDGRKPSLQADEKTLKVLGGLAKINCTNQEAADVLETSRRSFERFLQREPIAKEVWERGKGQGRATVRRYQMAAAEKGNATMLIWLGKQLLGQRDGQDLNINHDNPYTLSDAELIAIARSGSANGAGSTGGARETDSVH